MTLIKVDVISFLMVSHYPGLAGQLHGVVLACHVTLHVHSQSVTCGWSVTKILLERSISVQSLLADDGF